MKENRIIFCISFCVVIAVVMSGCGVKDCALEIPIGAVETALAEKEEAEDVNRTAVEETDISSEDEELLIVYVCGAVNHPGVVKLSKGSRIYDALEAAGGFTEAAVIDAVNLAALIVDGEKLYFPNREETEKLQRQEEMKREALIDINQADEKLLMSLPGIGESRAKDIISYREKNGGFKSKEDIKKVPGIKKNVYEKLCDQIVVQ